MAATGVKINETLVERVKRLTWDNRYEVLSGVTVALAQVPEAVAFSFLAKVDPYVGLTAAWIMGVVTSICGGRPAMISGATGAMATIMPGYVTKFGVGALFYAVIFAGVIQILLGLFRAGKGLKLISPAVMIGFVNGLAMLQGFAQFSSFKAELGGSGGHRRLNAFGVFTDGEAWLEWEQIGYMAIEVAVTMIITMILPKINKLLPSALTAIAVASFVEWVIFRNAGISTRLVGDVAKLGGSFPTPIWDQYAGRLPSLTGETVLLSPAVGDDLLSETLQLSVFLAIIGCVESLLTLNRIDEITETKSNPNRECIGQGIANVIAGLLGGMGGCAMIGQSMMNIQAGARSRLSTFISGAFTLIIVLAASKLIEAIPVAALVGVMFCVVYHTFEWSSLRLLAEAALPKRFRKATNARKIHRFDALIIIVVTVTTLFFDLAIAVVIGVLLQCFILAWEADTSLTVLSYQSDSGTRVYEVAGPLCFSTALKFLDSFADYRDDPASVEIHLHKADLHGFSAIDALNTLGDRYKRVGKVLRLRHIKDKCLKHVQKAEGLMSEAVEIQLEDDTQVLTPTGRLHLNVEHDAARSISNAEDGMRQRSGAASQGTKSAPIPVVEAVEAAAAVVDVEEDLGELPQG